MIKEPLNQRQRFLIFKGNEVIYLEIKSKTKKTLDPSVLFFYLLKTIK